ncbi:MAG: hypothetical protein FJ146_16690 [Deltaproteobacteria bacterium]|nr:hypothetical protein [Deltaproteobacteria bacterium]
MSDQSWKKKLTDSLTDLKAAIGALTVPYEYPKIASFTSSATSEIPLMADTVPDESFYLTWNSFVESGLALEPAQLLDMAKDQRVVSDPRYIRVLIERRVPVTQLVFRLLVHIAVNEKKDISEKFARLKSLADLTLSPFALGIYNNLRLYLDPERFACEMCKQIKDTRAESISSQISTIFRIPVSNGPYSSRVLLEYLMQEAHGNNWLEINDFRAFFANNIRDLERDDLSEFINFLIEAATLMPPASNVQYLRELIWDRLGIDDPRKTNRATIEFDLSAEASQRLSEWLNIIDLEFFFDKVVSDDQGRREFWQRYIRSIRRVRILLCSSDFATIPSELRKRFLSVIARIEPESFKSSAVLMQFDGFAIVEFGQKNHSCFVYDKPDVEPMIQRWLQANFIRSDQLKASEATRWPHAGDWHRIFQERLRAYGIRPE